MRNESPRVSQRMFLVWTRTEQNQLIAVPSFTSSVIENSIRTIH